MSNDKKISQLTVETPNDNDIFLTARNNHNKGKLWSALKTNVLKAINGLSSKAALVAADEFVINDSEDSNDPKKVTPEEIVDYTYGRSAGKGHYSSNGLKISGTNIVMNPYEIIADENLYAVTGDTTIADATALTASTWYAIAMKESDGVLSAIKAGAAGGWDVWTISGNQLNCSAIFSPPYNYMRGAISGVFYRILGIVLVNSTPNNFDYIVNIINMPKSYVKTRAISATTTVNNTTYTIVNFDTVEIDINSEFTLGVAASFNPKRSMLINTVFDVRWQANSWNSGTQINLILYKNSANIKSLGYIFKSVSANIEHRQLGYYYVTCNSGDSIQHVVWHNDGASEAIIPTLNGTITGLEIVEV